MIICAFATLAVSFYHFERSSVYFFADGLRVFLLILMLAAWIAMFFINGIRKRYGILIFGAAYWCVPLLIITIQNGITDISKYSLLLYVMSEYSDILVRYPVQGIADALSLPFQGVVLCFLPVLALVYFAGVLMNAPAENG